MCLNRGIKYYIFSENVFAVYKNKDERAYFKDKALEIKHKTNGGRLIPDRAGPGNATGGTSANRLGAKG
jgi:hypothetical protein